MMRGTRSHRFLPLSTLAIFMLCLGMAQARQIEPEVKEEWYFSPSIGIIGYEGDEEVEDGMILTFRLGYDFKHWLSVEGGLSIAPSLDENDVGFTEIDPATGETVTGRRSRSEGNPGFKDTWAAGLFVDGLYHFTRWEKIDPYLSLGAGFTWYGEEPDEDSFDPALRVGGGIMYHFNNEWALRADARTFLAGSDTEANMIADAGLVWTWGAHVGERIVATDGPLDTDRDGLTDAEEEALGTSKYDPDSDDDRLKDGPEVKEYKTNPLNADTDWDSLLDGAEVFDHKTNPLERDTDGGGVADGHEVIEDNTNPLDPSDDLLLFELYIQFDYDQAIIKPEFFGDLAKIGKVLSRNPQSTARIEGHADRTKKSGEAHNKALSQRRAQSVLNHLVARHGIEKGRMTAVGYGFERPKAPNDPATGNPVNRRVEVYIQGVTDRTGLDEVTAPPAIVEVPPENK